MTRLFLLLAVMLGPNSYGQNLKPTKAQLLKTFEYSIHQESKRKIQTNSHPWLICNKDSSFYKSDTLYLYDNYLLQNCCESIGWTFYKPNAFVQNELQSCREPANEKVTTNSDFHTIDLTEDNGQTTIKVYQARCLIDTFIITSLDSVNLDQMSQTSTRLTLVRQAMKK